MQLEYNFLLTLNVLGTRMVHSGKMRGLEGGKSSLFSNKLPFRQGMVAVIISSSVCTYLIFLI